MDGNLIFAGIVAAGGVAMWGAIAHKVKKTPPSTGFLPDYRPKAESRVPTPRKKETFRVVCRMGGGFDVYDLSGSPVTDLDVLVAVQKQMRPDTPQESFFDYYTPEIPAIWA